MMSEIKDGMYVYVGGTVERAFHSQSGIAAVIAVTSPKKQYPDRVTVWGVPEAVGTGDRLKVKGWLSWTVTEKDDKKYVNVSVNQPEVIAHENLIEAKTVTAEQVAKDILGASPVDELAPF